MTAVPFPLSVKDRPPGSGPDSARAGAGYPVVRTVSLSAAPALTLMARIFLMAGALVTVRVNAWVAVPFLFLAVSVSGYTPAAPFVGAGEPVAVTVKVNATPNAAVSAEPLVNAGP